MQRKILITGGAGFIGSNFVRYHIEEHPDDELLIVDNLTYAGNLANIHDCIDGGRVRFIKADISDRDAMNGVISDYCPEFIINFAAESHVDRSIEDPGVFLRTNVIGVQTLLDIVNDSDVESFLQVSTDEVYGSLGPEGLFKETTHLDPSSPYSASKASADLIAMAYRRTFGTPIVVTRCSNNYGPYQFPEKLIPLVIMKCMNGKSIPIYGDGMNIRDWLFVDDHCSALDAVMRHGRKGRGYNIGGNNERTNLEIVHRIIRTVHDSGFECSSEELVTYVKDRRGHDRRYAIDSSRIQSELGWEPKVDFEEGMDRTIHWYLQNRRWLQDIINRDYLEFYERNYLKR